MNEKKKNKKKRGATEEQAAEFSTAAGSTEAAEDAGSAETGTASTQNAPADQASDASVGDKLTELNDRYLRAKAELDNYRKRTQREFAEIREYTKSITVQEFFTVLDHFQMAMDHVQENPDFKTLKQGMDMILGEFHRTFEALGVQRVDAAQKEFDPNEHEAVSHEPSETVPAGHVIRQWKYGYRMGDRLLRPATVVVSSGPAKDDADSNE